MPAYMRVFLVIRHVSVSIPCRDYKPKNRKRSRACKRYMEQATCVHVRLGSATIAEATCGLHDTLQHVGQATAPSTVDGCLICAGML